VTAPKIFESGYYTHMAELERSSWWNAGMRDLAARLLGGVKLPAKGMLLDVGCGSGQTMGWLRGLLPGWSAVGVDVALDGLHAAREGGGEHVLAASALDLPFPDASFELVITLDVLQHLPLGGGDEVALREIRRVLRPGGVLFVRTNAQALPRIADDTEYNFHKYGSAELRTKLASAGFRVQRLGRVNALLGLAEIPRELRALGVSHGGYAGLISTVPRLGAAWKAKRAWLGLEGRLLAAGLSIPLGRTHVALARATDGGIRS